MNTAEAAAMSTQAFIDENPAQIVITRTQRVQTSAGGSRRAVPADLPAFTARMVGGNLENYRLTEEGEQVLPTYTLVAMPDVDVQRWDTFSWNGHTYKVLWIQDQPEWAVRAEVIERGQ
jgi:hypothetical protein